MIGDRPVLDPWWISPKKTTDRAYKKGRPVLDPWWILFSNNFIKASVLGEISIFDIKFAGLTSFDIKFAGLLKYDIERANSFETRVLGSFS